MNVFFDIETIPQQPEAGTRKAIADTIAAPGTMKVPETISAWHNGEGKYAGEKDALIADLYHKTGLDGAKGEIISIAWAIEYGEIFSLSRNLGDSESALLTKFYDRLRTGMKMKPPYFVGHNIGGFDLKFLFHRSVVLQVNPRMDLGQWGRHSSNFYDTMLAWAGWGQKISLDNLCAALGIPGKPDDIDGSKVWDFVKDGKIARVEEYNRNDVEKVRLIYNRLRFTTPTLLEDVA
jgi:predicted PolB exonuclease-like 3'-5' exonuclease